MTALPGTVPRASRVRGLPGVALLLLAFLMPAIMNRSPVIYADTVGYFHIGEGAFEVFDRRGGQRPAGVDAVQVEARAAARQDDGISTARSVFYGLVFVTMFHIAGIWAMLLLQVGVTIAALRNALPQLTDAGPRTALTIIAVTGLAGAAAFTNTLAPDLFAGLAVLAAAVLLARFRTLSSASRLTWLGFIVAGCLFHKSILAIMLLMAMYGCVVLLWRREPLGGLIWLGAALAVGIVAMVGVNVAVERVSGQPPADPPFLLARIVGDGTAQQYLATACATRRFELCRHHLPADMTENEFLWGRVPARSVMTGLSLSERLKVNAEAGEIVAGTLRAYPVEQAVASAGNFARQMLLVGIREFGVSPGKYASDQSALRPDLLRYASDSSVARGTMPLGWLSWSMTTAYLAGFAVLGAIAAVARWRARVPLPVWRVVQFIIAGVVANAAVCSIIGGLFDRYQGRVAWLIPFAALCLAATVYNAVTTSGRAAR